MPLPSVSSWPGLGTSGQLSQASPRPSWSRSAWPGLASRGQASSMSLTVSAAVSGPGGAHGDGGGITWPAELGPGTPSAGGVVGVVGVDAVGQPVAVGVGETVVDPAVAVVVDVVADLGRGGAGGAGLRDAGDAVVDGALAGADATGGRAEVFIDQGVAVVVDAVAHL